MSTTGIDTWAVDLADIAAVYPFQGTEVIMTILGVALWIGWHIWQINHENRQIAEEEAKLRQPGALKDAVDKAAHRQESLE
ncbi:MAG: hypothetical protein R3245_10995 [Kiloniellales bacterium]|nr:hypothetical protein [Kiloniellales bacterium]